MSDESLTDVLRGSSAFVPAQRTETVTEPVNTESSQTESLQEPEPKVDSAAAKAAPVRDEGGKFAKTEEQAPAKEPDKPVPSHVAAIIDERRKRQSVEARLRELQSAAPQTETPKVSVFEDEDKGVAQRVDAHTQGLRGQLFAQSMRLARLEHKEDFGEAESAFMDAAEADPRLYQQLRTAEDPGEYIYSIGSHIKELGPYGGNLGKRDEAKFSELRAQITERDTKLSAMQAEIDALKKTQSELDAVPRSLNKSPSATSGRAQVSEDDEPLSKIVRFGNT